jgi:predicted MFS family arabinose efflux permease
MNVSSGVVMATLPIIALHHLELNAAMLGASYALQGIAMVGGNLLAKRATAARLPVLWVMGSAILLQAPGFLAFAGAGSFVGVFVGQALIGLGAGLWNVPSSSALIIAAKGPTRSRTLASYKTVAVMGPPLGAVAGGALASGIGTGWALTVVASVTTLNVIVFAIRGARLDW